MNNTASLSQWHQQFDIQDEIMDWMDKNTPGWKIKNNTDGLETLPFMYSSKKKVIC